MPDSDLGSDPELVAMFHTEAEGRLATLAAGLARPGAVPLADLRREAHTIKGAAMIVGFSGIGEVAERIETLLQQDDPPLDVIGKDVETLRDALHRGVDAEPGPYR